VKELIVFRENVMKDYWIASPLALRNERPLGCIPFGTMKRKTYGLRPLWHYEMKMDVEHEK
jgi:hypothetical protein